MISIILVNYKVKREIFNCIGSIIEYKPKVNFEIIVVDNDEKNIIESDLKDKYPKVSYIKSSKNIGFGAGNNLGAKHAKGEYLFFLNPDTEVLSGTLDNLYNFIISKKNIGAASPLLLNDRGVPHIVQGSQHLTVLRTIFSLSFIHKFFPNNPIANKFFLRNWDKKSIKQVDVAPGTAFLISKELFNKLGGFDEKLFLFFEEADLAKKITSLGLKNYIFPQAKIIHLGGESTKKKDDIREIFDKSKFYYFKKWHGLLGAIIVQVFTSISKVHILLTAILLVGFFLRVFKLNEFMVFIGDQGWFYLSARDMLLTGKIPLVGITSSHTWLHQGPYWTYIVAFLFWIFNFNPIAPAYFTAFLGALTIWLIYKVSKKLFSEKIGLISAVIYATSPLIIANDRFAYHTSLIPFFTLIFIFFIYKWLKGNPVFFVFALIILGALYNFELATFSLGGVLIVFLAFGLFKRKKWAVGLLNRKTILFSVLGLATTMFPILIYDLKNGFLQTFGFLLWILYKIFNIPFDFSVTDLGNNTNILYFLLHKYKLLTFANSFFVSILFLFLSFIIFLYLLKKEKKISSFIIGITFLIMFLAFIVNKTPSDAYLPVFFPIIIIISAIFWSYVIKKIKFPGLIILAIFVFMNIYYFVNHDLDSNNADFIKRKGAVSRIIESTSGNQYNLIGKGEGSQFESFTMNYEYLLWYYYDSNPSKNPVNLKIYIEEKNGKILITKND